MDFIWYCRNCGFKADSSRYYWRCPQCRHPIDIEFAYEWKPRGSRLKRYTSMLPAKPVKTLGEGGTPLVKRKIYGVHLWLKLDYLNPTGSFKDRGACISMAYAYKLGFRKAVEDTSGNTGISVTAYALLYGIKPLIYMPKNAPEGKKLLIKSIGGEIIETRDRGEAANRVLREIGKEVYYVAHTWSPLFIEGNTTIAYEVYEQGFRGDIVILPIGSGGLILGVYKGFLRLKELGLWDTEPLFIGVQGYSCHPVYKEIHKRSEKGDSSLADGIMVSNPPRLNEIKEVITKHGHVLLVNNNDIITGLKKLYKLGFIVEPTSATVIAGLKKALEQGIIDKGDRVLTVLTGSGLKMLQELHTHMHPRI